MIRKKILLVDDSTTILMVEEMALNNGVYEFIRAKNGLEAIEIAAAERPDLILLDINMPKMDGFEACKKLRSQTETSETPIIMVTTRAEIVNLETGYQSGCNDYITKPIDNIELVAKVKNYLGE